MLAASSSPLTATASATGAVLAATVALSLPAGLVPPAPVAVAVTVSDDPGAGVGVVRLMEPLLMSVAATTCGG